MSIFKISKEEILRGLLLFTFYFIFIVFYVCFVNQFIISSILLYHNWKINITIIEDIITHQEYQFNFYDIEKAYDFWDTWFKYVHACHIIALEREPRK